LILSKVLAILSVAS